MEKVKLILDDVERWRFTLYKTQEDEWYCDFSYSPVSFFDTSILIKLTKEEQEQAQNDRDTLIALADRIKDSHNEYLTRGLDKEHFIFIN